MLPLKPEGQTRTLMLIDMEGGPIEEVRVFGLVKSKRRYLE
jgi:hypothetical protein